MKIFISTFLCFFCLVYQMDAQINVKLSKNLLGVNETFTLDFSASNQSQSEPNFAPLNKDFEIISSTQKYMTSIINNKVSTEIHWHLTLQPKREGFLTIPSITFGNDESTPQTIEVIPARFAEQDDTLYIKVDVSPKEVAYEQSQIIYTIRLFRSVNLAQAALSEVKVNDPDAIIEKLGSDLEYEHRHSNGGRYIVLERKYAVYPQHAGDLTFSPIQFEGHVIKGGGSFFNMQTEIKRIASTTAKIKIKPIPAPFDKNSWLAAKDVKLSEEWSSDPKSMTVGEPITWTLTIAAEGCLGNQIPTPSLSLPQNLKNYLDKPLVSNANTNKGLIGSKQIKTALIATSPGEIIVPEIEIKWWDLNNDQLKIARLPSRTIQVLDSEIAMNSSLSKNDSALPLEVPPIAYQSADTLPIWAWCLIGLNSIWIIGLVRITTRRFFKKDLKEKGSPPQSLKQIKSFLKKACLENESKQAESYLIKWAICLFPNSKPNLMNLKNNFPPELQIAIDELYATLYGQKRDWQGLEMWKAISAYKPGKPEKDALAKKGYNLSELYE